MCRINLSQTKIAVIGIGLIGASFALAIKHKKLPFSVSLYDKNPEAREEARALSIGGRIEDELSEAVAGAGLVVMAVPVGAMAEVMAAAAPHLAKGCVVTDTGSTKRSVIRDTKDLIPEGCHFIPGHPLAGTEFSGPAAGFPSLFEGRYWLVLPNGAEPERKLPRWRALLAGLGAMCEQMTADYHDGVLAITSHLLHLIAYTIVGTAVDLGARFKK